MRTCTKCGPQPEENFYRRSRAAGGGLMSECKTCFNARPRNKARERDGQRRYRAAHPGLANQQAARYRSRHRTERRVINHERRAGNRRLTAEDREYMEILQGDPCVYCGAVMEHVDHIVSLHRGGDVSWDNLAGACGRCNQSKGSKPLLTFLGDR